MALKMSIRAWKTDGELVDARFLIVKASHGQVRSESIEPAEQAENDGKVPNQV